MTNRAWIAILLTVAVNGKLFKGSKLIRCDNHRSVNYQTQQKQIHDQIITRRKKREWQLGNRFAHLKDSEDNSSLDESDFDIRSNARNFSKVNMEESGSIAESLKEDGSDMISQILTKMSKEQDHLRQEPIDEEGEPQVIDVRTVVRMFQDLKVQIDKKI